MFIARGVCLGVVSTDVLYRIALRMPELSDEARMLYVRAHGEERYERYNDKDGTRHGAIPPDMDQEFDPPPQFFHRPEHDVESVYWSMVSALLRVHPRALTAKRRQTQIWIRHGTSFFRTTFQTMAPLALTYVKASFQRHEIHGEDSSLTR